MLQRAFARSKSAAAVAAFVAFALTAGLPAVANEAGPTASAPSGDAAQGPDDVRCAPQEVESLRTRDSKTVVNADCSYTATFEEYTHYESEPGRWERVDLRFRQDGREWISDRHDVIVKVAGATVTVTDRNTGQGIRWITPGIPAVAGDRASFSSDGLDWSYSLTKPGVKLVASVAEPRGDRTYTFPYALVGGARDLEVDEDGNLQSRDFTIPRALALGAGGETYRADPWELLPGNRVSFHFDDSDLPAEAFPYELDPTTIQGVTMSYNSGGIYSTGGAYPPACAGTYTTSSSSPQVAVERSRSSDPNAQNWVSNAMVRWDTSSIPDNATINIAKVEVGTTGQLGGQRALTADWYTSWPIDCSDHSVTAQTSALAGIPIATLQNDASDGYVMIPFDNSNGVSKFDYTGVRFHINGGQLSSYEQNVFTFHGYGSTTRTEPRLIVIYDNPVPSITYVSDSPDPLAPGGDVTFTVGWNEPQGEAVIAVICKTNSIAAGRCTGGTWATGNIQYPSPSTATYRTSSADFGTNSYYAFACDTTDGYPDPDGCSPGAFGTFTVTNAPTILSASDSPDPAGAGSPVTFSVGWSDPNPGDTAKAIICKTNSISSGSCPGGSWATGNQSATSPSTATYPGSTSDFGTKTYYAFACDSVGACSSSRSGTFTVNNAPSLSSASDTPDPVAAGSPVTFNLTWSDANLGDSVRAVICKSGSISSGTCPGGTWSTGAFKSSGPASATYTTSSADVGTKSYWAFACDSLNACSASFPGTFTVQNTAPHIYSATDSPDPVRFGSPVTFTTAWSDPNPGDTVRTVICKTSAISSATCPGGTWASGSLTSATPSSATYSTTLSDVGTHNYYGFVCDQSNSCSGAVPGTFTVGPNRPPAVSFSVSPSSGDRSTVFNASLAGTTDPENDSITYRIEWGDGASSNSQQSSHRYQNAGTYTVSGRACDSFGACTTHTRTVTVAFSNRPPSANLTVTPARGDLNTTFSANLSGSDPEQDALSYEIEWGDGSTTQGSTGTHKYAEPGVYTVTGVVADQFGATNEDSEKIEVCVVYTNGTCAQTPVPVPNPCRDYGTGCPDDPTYVELPREVSDLLQARVPFTPDGRILSVTANVEQVYAIPGARCTEQNFRKDCDERLREIRFAKRILKLADKGEDTEDGMAYVPDMILLQEVKPSDARAIAEDLRGLGPRFTFRVAVARSDSDDPKFDKGQDGVKRECEAHYASEVQEERCKRLAFLEADGAILYNARSLSPIKTSHHDARYWVEDHKLCTGTAGPHTPPKGAIDDEDGDLAPDCKIKWERQYSASFNELALTEQGVPNTEEEFTGVVVAAASVHLVSKNKFPGQAVHADVKHRQVQGLKKHMDVKHPEANVRILGGDFNIHRCSTKDDDEPGDYPEGVLSVCSPYEWWTYLTSDPQNYVEAVWAARGTQDDRLEDQYKDGCLTLADGGPECDTPRYRHKRIDFIFGSAMPVEDASHDLSCGQIEPSNQTTYDSFPPHCGNRFNDERYSDHRLVWAMLARDDIPLP